MRCTGGCNDFDVGGICGGKSCKAGQNAGVKIQCLNREYSDYILLHSEQGFDLKFWQINRHSTFKQFYVCYYI